MERCYHNEATAAYKDISQTSQLGTSKMSLAMSYAMELAATLKSSSVDCSIIGAPVS